MISPQKTDSFPLHDFHQVTWPLEQSFLLGPTKWLGAQGSVRDGEYLEKRQENNKQKSLENEKKTRLKNESSFSEFLSVSQTVFFLESDEFLSKMKHFDSISERLLNLRPTHETPSKNPAPVATISTQRDVDLRYVAREYKKSSTL